MKINKRILIMLMCLIMALFMLAACGNDTSGKPTSNAVVGDSANVADAANTEPAKVADLQTSAKAADGTVTTSKTATKDSSTKAAVSATNATKANKTAAKDDGALHCTFSISCGTILDNIDDLDSAKTDLVPEDGVIYAAKEVEFTKGETVFDVLLRETKANKIHMEFSKTPIYKSNYIEGINNIYEFDCGPLSGWMYKVNGTYPNYGCSGYKLKDGDVIKWIYTCDLGKDIGAPEWKEVAAPSE